METTTRSHADRRVRMHSNILGVAAVAGFAGLVLLVLLLAGAAGVGANEDRSFNTSGAELVFNPGFEDWERHGWDDLTCPGECDPQAVIEHDLFVGLSTRPYRDQGFLEASTSVAGSSVGQIIDAEPQPGDFYTGQLWMRSPFDGLVDVEVVLTATGGTEERSGTRVLVSEVWTPIDVVLAVEDADHDGLRIDVVMHSENVHYNVDEVTVTGSLADPEITPSNPFGLAATVSSPEPGLVNVVGWAVDPSHPEKAISTRTIIGGLAGEDGVESFDNGLTTLFRNDLAVAQPWIKTGHGFNTAIETSKIGKQRVCTYGLNIGQGEDSLLSCRSVVIGSAIYSCGGMPATIVGTPGDDELRGTAANDVIAGLQGNDTISGLRGDDIICGGFGDDVLYGNGGFDIMFGAQGNDVLYAANGDSGGRLIDTAGARMFGGAGDDVIYGSTRWDRMQGGNGADQLWGFGGRDWIRAGANNDVVDSGPGIDDVGGGSGNDRITAAGSGNKVHGNRGIDTCSVGANPAYVRSCERS